MTTRRSKPSRRVEIPAESAAALDGRKQRSQQSQRRIVEAMLELVAAGNISPSAEQVATRAGVGLRSVFRHFKDMDGLYGEMQQVLAARLENVARQPFVAANWPGQMLELVGRRAAAFETMAPFLRAAQAHRHRSEVLRAGHARFAATLRRILVERLAGGQVRDKRLVETVDLLLSFEAWQRLRDTQKLSAAEAKAVLADAVRAVLGIAGGT